MFRLRHAVFSERLHWDVNSENGMERDQFDQCDPVYVLVKEDSGDVVGMSRLLPTTGPYMMKDIFPQLLHGEPAPRNPTVWEISRFAFARSKPRAQGFGFSEIPLRILETAIKFGRNNGIHYYVAVVSTAIERMLRNMGLELTRFGAPVRIGNVMTVALWFPTSKVTKSAAAEPARNNTEKVAA
jgi:acyl homoserine lactone synthase